MRKLATFALTALLMTGCNAQQTAQKAAAIIGAAFAAAQQDISAVPQQDQAAYSNFVTLGQTLDHQLQACLAASGTKSAKLLACFNGFAAGLNSPAELVQLRILSGPSQNKVQKYLDFAIAAVNIAVAAYGGSEVTAPQVQPTPTPKAELRQMYQQLERGL